MSAANYRVEASANHPQANASPESAHQGRGHAFRPAALIQRVAIRRAVALIF